MFGDLEIGPFDLSDLISTFARPFIGEIVFIN